MKRADLANGMSVLYNLDPEGSVIIQYPDGSRVSTTWAHLARIESVINLLRGAYECLLKRAGRDDHLPVETLMEIDDLLYALDGGSGVRRDATSPASPKPSLGR